MGKTTSKYLAKRKQHGPPAAGADELANAVFTSPVHLRRSARLATRRNGEQAEAPPQLGPRLVRKRQRSHKEGPADCSAGSLGSLPEEVGVATLAMHSAVHA